MTPCCLAALPADAVFHQSGGVVDLSAVGMLLGGEAGPLTVLSVPRADEGALICQGAELSPFDELSPDELDSLVLVPASEEVFCRIELLAAGASGGQSLTLIVTGMEGSAASAAAEAGLYSWAWAQNGYFSHIGSY